MLAFQENILSYKYPYDPQIIPYLNILMHTHTGISERDQKTLLPRYFVY